MDLKLLAYNPKWIEYGFLTQEQYDLQLTEFKKGEDTNKEHYRYSSFIDFIEKKSAFEDNDISHFIELVELDEDQAMASSTLVQLLKSEKLTSSQYMNVKLAILKYDFGEKLIKKYEATLQGSFNNDFCHRLETAINNALANSDDSNLQGLWCDGVEPQHFSKKYINDNRSLTTRMWMGKDGQTEYSLTIHLGNYSLRRYAKGSSMEDCIPDTPIKQWLTIDEDAEQIDLHLR